MTLEELRKEDHEEEKDEEDEKANKSFDEALIETLSTLTEHVKALSESQASLEERVEKALFEEPKTQLDLTPSGTADVELNMVLKDARSNGYEGLSHVARRILAGDYGSPDTTQDNGGYY